MRIGSSCRGVWSLPKFKKNAVIGGGRIYIFNIRWNFVKGESDLLLYNRKYCFNFFYCLYETICEYYMVYS